jgi:hypothetical protein
MQHYVNESGIQIPLFDYYKKEETQILIHKGKENET